MIWTDSTTTSSLWGLELYQILTLINNTYSINYSKVNINGQLIADWETQSQTGNIWL